MSNKILVLLSGGMDSAAALAFTLAKAKLEDEIIAMSFYLGNKRNTQEIKASKRLCRHYKVSQVLIDLKDMQSTIGNDCYRNGILSSIAASYAESKEIGTIVIGIHADDAKQKNDADSSFIDQLAIAVSIGTEGKVELLAPLKRMEKAQVAGLASSLNVPFEYTYSCEHGSELHCGVCKSCMERRKAFKLIAVEDVTYYEC